MSIQVRLILMGHREHRHRARKVQLPCPAHECSRGAHRLQAHTQLILRQVPHRRTSLPQPLQSTGKIQHLTGGSLRQATHPQQGTEAFLLIRGGNALPLLGGVRIQQHCALHGDAGVLRQCGNLYSGRTAHRPAHELNTRG